MPMNLHILLLLLLNVLGTLNAASIENSTDLDQEWEDFKKTFEKVYDVTVEAIRKQNFEDNLKIIAEHNAGYEQGKHSFQMGLNAYADWAFEEFLQFFTGLIPRRKIAPIPFVVPPGSHINESVDWREAGKVSPVKDQKDCGSCYAFAAVAAMESCILIKHDKKVFLSEQNIIDCSFLQGNLGCSGGLMDNAYEYIMMNKGIDSEKSYPYKSRTGLCMYRRENSAATCSGYSDIDPGTEENLMAAVSLNGPVSCGIDASNPSFHLYKTGIYDEPNCSSTDLDHAVLVVGYGTSDGKDYWILKNSWGTSWGENGFMKLARNNNNTCGIASLASFPVCS